MDFGMHVSKRAGNDGSWLIGLSLGTFCQFKPAFSDLHHLLSIFFKRYSLSHVYTDGGLAAKLCSSFL